MIAGRGGDHAFLLLLGRKLGEGITRAAFFETAGALEIIELGINFHPGQLAEWDRLWAGRFVDRAFNAAGSCFDVAEGSQGSSRRSLIEPISINYQPSTFPSSTSRTLFPSCS